MKRAAVFAGLGVSSLIGYLVAAGPTSAVLAQSAATPQAPHVVHAAPVVYRVALPRVDTPVPKTGTIALVKSASRVAQPKLRVAVPAIVPRRVLQVFTETSIRPIAFTIRRVPTSHLNVGSTEVVQTGRDGSYRVDVRLYERGGKVVASRVVDRVVISRARPQVVAFGTHRPTPPPPPPPPPPPRHLQGIPPWVAHLNWSALAMCESGGNPRSIGPGFYGLYQFSLPTWYGVGGVGNPIDNSAAEQTYRAELLYLNSGSSPWPWCGSRLFSH